MMDRDCDHQGNEGRRERAGDQRQDAVVRIGEQRCPHGVGEKVFQRHVLEKRRGLDQEDRDDGEGREHRHQAGGEQKSFDDPIADLAITQAAARDQIR
jgi:hypothetical protein